MKILHSRIRAKAPQIILCWSRENLLSRVHLVSSETIFSESLLLIRNYTHAPLGTLCYQITS